MAKYPGHDWVTGETIAEPLIQALDDGARDAAQAVEDLAASVATAYSTITTANADGSLNFTDTGWGISVDGAPTFYGRGSVPAGRGATAPIFAVDGSAVLIPTGA